jgi:hypothetical protein
MTQIDGGTLIRCSACEWPHSIGTQAPTGTASAILAAGGTAITVASGGASFTSGMVLAYDTGLATEILTCAGGSTATNIPVSAAVKGHLSAVTFGQLNLTLTLAGQFGLEQVPPNPGYGF